MRKIHQSIAVPVLALVGLVGCDQEQRAIGDANPARVAEMQQTHRDLWLGHIILVQHVVLYNATNNPAERDAAEKDVVANAKQIAIMVAPFYGEAKAEKFFTLLVGHVAAVKEYSEATVGGISLGRMPRLHTWHRMPTTSLYSSTEQILTCRKRPFVS